MSNIKSKIWVKSLVVGLVCVFTLNSIPFVREANALAPWAGSEKAFVRIQAWQLALERSGRLIYADDDEKRSLLRANDSPCLLLSAGKILASEGLKEDSLKLLGYIIHEEIEAVMQIMAKEDEGRYQGIKELILKHFPPNDTNNLPINLYVNHTVARAFEWISLVKGGLISEKQISVKEFDFVKTIERLIDKNKHTYFTAPFWDWRIRETQIRVALANGQRFHQVANRDTDQSPTPNIPVPPSGHSAAFFGLLYSPEFRGKAVPFEELRKKIKSRRTGKPIAIQTAKVDLSLLARSGLAEKNGKGESATYTSTIDDETLIGIIQSELSFLKADASIEEVQLAVAEYVFKHEFGKKVDQVKKFLGLPKKSKIVRYVKKEIKWAVHRHELMCADGKKVVFYTKDYKDYSAYPVPDKQQIFVEKIRISNITHKHHLAPDSKLIEIKNKPRMFILEANGKRLSDLKANEIDLTVIEAIGFALGKLHELGILHNDLCQKSHKNFDPESYFKKEHIFIEKTAKSGIKVKFIDFSLSIYRPSSGHLMDWCVEERNDVEIELIEFARHLTKHSINGKFSEGYLRGVSAARKELGKSAVPANAELKRQLFPGDKPPAPDLMEPVRQPLSRKKTARKHSLNEGPFHFLVNWIPDLSDISVGSREYRRARKHVFDIFKDVNRNEVAGFGSISFSVMSVIPGRKRKRMTTQTIDKMRVRTIIDENRLSDRELSPSPLPTAICYEDGQIEINSTFIKLVAYLERMNLWTIEMKDRIIDEKSKKHKKSNLLESIIYSIALHEIRGHYHIKGDGSIEFIEDESIAQPERGFYFRSINVKAILFYWFCLCENRAGSLYKRVNDFLREIDESTGDTYGEILGINEKAYESFAKAVCSLHNEAKGCKPKYVHKHVDVNEIFRDAIQEGETRRFAFDEGIKAPEASSANEARKSSRNSHATLIKAICTRFRDREVSVKELAEELAFKVRTVMRGTSGFVAAGLIAKKGSDENATLELLLKDISEEELNLLIELIPHSNLTTKELKRITLAALGPRIREPEAKRKIGDGVFKPMDIKYIPIARNWMWRNLPREEEAYKKALSNRILQSFIALTKNTSDALKGEMGNYAEILANTLLKYDRDSLKGLVERGILTDDDVPRIWRRDAEFFHTDEFARKISSMLDDYSLVNINDRSKKRFISHFFTVEELELYKKLFPYIPPGKLIDLCRRYPRQMIEVLRNIDKTMKEMPNEAEFVGIPKWAFRTACLASPWNPRRLLRRAKRRAEAAQKIVPEAASKYYTLFEICLSSPGKLQAYIASLKKEDMPEPKKPSSLAPQSPPTPKVHRNKRRNITKKEMKYKDTLRDMLYRSLVSEAPDLYDEDRKAYAREAADTLVRYDESSMDSLIARGIVTPHEAEMISKQSERFSTERLAREIISIVAGYKRLSISPVRRKEYLSHFYTESELIALEEKYPDFPPYVRTSACLSHPNGQEEFLRRVSRERGRIRDKKEFKKTPDWIITWACANNLENPDQALRDIMSGKKKIFGRPWDAFKKKKSQPHRSRHNTTGIPKPHTGSPQETDTRIRKLWHELDDGVITIVEASRTIMEEILPRWVYSKEAMIAIPTVIGILKQGLNENTIPPLERVFARETVDILTRHEKAQDQTELKEELGKLVYRMFSTMNFFTSYRWYIKIKKTIQSLEDKLSAGTDITEIVKKLYKLMHKDAEEPAEELIAWYDNIGKIGKVIDTECDNRYMDILIDVNQQCNMSFQSLLAALDIIEIASKKGADIGKAAKLCTEYFNKYSTQLERDMAAFGYLILNGELDKKDNYDEHHCIAEEKIKEAQTRGYTLDRVTEELKATLAFNNAITSLKETAQHEEFGYNAQAVRLEEQAASYDKTGQSLILYADDLLENAAVMDLESTLKNISTKHNILKGGKIVIFARNPANGTILKRMIKRADPDLATITITEEELKETKNLNGSEIKEIESVVELAKARGTKNILALIKGPTRHLEELVVPLKDFKFPIVIVGAMGKGVYSFAEAITRSIKKADSGWLIVLSPIRPYSEEIQRQYEKYLRSLKLLQAA